MSRAAFFRSLVLSPFPLSVPSLTLPARIPRSALDHQEFFERKRMATYEKETARWGKVHQQDAYFDQRAEDLKEEPISNNNKSKVRSAHLFPYDPVGVVNADP